ncbi:MAG: hypothetical protein Q9196_007196 [Gyalolechia fulgens]
MSEGPQTMPSHAHAANGEQPSDDPVTRPYILNKINQVIQHPGACQELHASHRRDIEYLYRRAHEANRDAKRTDSELNTYQIDCSAELASTNARQTYDGEQLRTRLFGVENRLVDSELGQGILQEQHRGLQDHVGRMERTVEALKAGHQRLGPDLGRIQHDVEAIKAGLQEQGTDVGQIQQDKETLEGQYKGLQDSGRQTTKDIGAMKEGYQVLRTDIGNIRQSVETWQQKHQELEEAMKQRSEENQNSLAGRDASWDRLRSQINDLQKVMRQFRGPDTTDDPMDLDTHPTSAEVLAAAITRRVEDLERHQEELQQSRLELQESQTTHSASLAWIQGYIRSRDLEAIMLQLGEWMPQIKALDAKLTAWDASQSQPQPQLQLHFQQQQQQPQQQTISLVNEAWRILASIDDALKSIIVTQATHTRQFEETQTARRSMSHEQSAKLTSISDIAVGMQLNNKAATEQTQAQIQQLKESLEKLLSKSTSPAEVESPLPTAAEVPAVTARFKAVVLVRHHVSQISQEEMATQQSFRIRRNDDDDDHHHPLAPSNVLAVSAVNVARG